MTPRFPDLGIFMVTDRQINKQTDGPNQQTIALPVAHVSGVIRAFCTMNSISQQALASWVVLKPDVLPLHLSAVLSNKHAAC